MVAGTRQVACTTKTNRKSRLFRETLKESQANLVQNCIAVAKSENLDKFINALGTSARQFQHDCTLHGENSEPIILTTEPKILLKLCRHDLDLAQFPKI